MWRPAVEYRLIPFEGRKSSDPELLAALRIYAECTPVSERTDTNQILYWHERNRKRSTDRLLPFGLSVNDEIVGFAEIAWLAEPRIAILDYMTIADASNRNSVFFNFIDLVTNYLLNNDLIFSYFVPQRGLQLGVPSGEAKTWPGLGFLI